MPFPGGFAHHSSVAPSSATAEGSHWGLRPGAPAGLEPLYVSIVDHGVDGVDALWVDRSPYPAKEGHTRRLVVKLQFERPIRGLDSVLLPCLAPPPPPPSRGGAMSPCTWMLTSRTCSLLRHPRHRRSQRRSGTVQCCPPAWHWQVRSSLSLEVVVGSDVPDGALDGCDSRCVGERRRLVPVLVALYVYAVQRIYCSPL